MVRPVVAYGCSLSALASVWGADLPRVSENPPVAASAVASMTSEAWNASEWEPLDLSEANEWLSATNKYRCMHGVPPLEWSASVAAPAQAWANRGVFGHSNCYAIAPPAGPAGENLAMGYGSIAAAVKGWYDEVKVCQWPGCQQSTDGGMVGHFTAMIWKGAKELGCGVNRNKRLYVCHYKGSDSLDCTTPNMGGCYNTNVQQAVKSEAACGGGGGYPSPSPSPSPAPSPAPSPSHVQHAFSGFALKGSYAGCVFTSQHTDTTATSAEGCAEKTKAAGDYSFIYTPTTGKCSLGGGASISISYGYGPQGEWYFTSEAAAVLAEVRLGHWRSFADALVAGISGGALVLITLKVFAGKKAAHSDALLADA